jgi:hypothetical protein
MLLFLQGGHARVDVACSETFVITVPQNPRDTRVWGFAVPQAFARLPVFPVLL